MAKKSKKKPTYFDAKVSSGLKVASVLADGTHVPIHSQSSYDVIFYDTIGNAYSRSILKAKPSGAAEIAVVKYAHWLAEQGYSVLCLNAIEQAESDGGVTYDNYKLAGGGTCKALVIVRYSSIPNIKADRTVVWSVDADARFHEHQKSISAPPGAKYGKLICLSPWHASLFRGGWDIQVIPSALPDHLYEYQHVTRDPNKYVYCSAVMKGLPMTLNAWKDIKSRRPEFAEAKLFITTPGYDKPDLEHIARTPDAVYLGDLQADAVEQELRTAAGMFFINSFPETFCLAAVLAETVGCRPHVYFHADPGAVPWTLRSRFPTSNAQQFEEDLICSHVGRFTGLRPNDFRMSTVMPQWLEVLGFETQKVRAKSVSSSLCLLLLVSEKTTPEALKRCVDSVRSIIKCACIVVDPDSKQRPNIFAVFGEHHETGIPVDIHEEPWVNFGHNRSKVIEHARGMADYNLMLDADDCVELEPWFQLGELRHDHYDIIIRDHEIEYWRGHIFKNDSDYYYEGAMHEHLSKRSPGGFSPKLYGIAYRRTGAGTDASRHEKAVAALQHNSRSAFYYAQELKDSGRYQDALHAYSVRASIETGFWEEVFISLMEIARCHVRLNHPQATVEVAYAQAYEHRKERGPEALTELTWYLMDRKQWSKAYHYGRLALNTPFPTQDLLFVERAPYEWKLKDACSIAAYYAGDKKASIALCEELLSSGLLPMGEVQRVRTNLEISKL